MVKRLTFPPIMSDTLVNGMVPSPSHKFLIHEIMIQNPLSLGQIGLISIVFTYCNNITHITHLTIISPREIDLPRVQQGVFASHR